MSEALIFAIIAFLFMFIGVMVIINKIFDDREDRRRHERIMKNEIFEDDD